MALVLANRVRDSTLTTGTGTITLANSPPAGYQAFSVIGNTNTTFYTIQGDTTEWEIGIGTYASAGPTLARTTVLASSSGGAAVSFSAGTKQVFCDLPTEKAVYLDASGNAIALGTIASAVLTNATGLPVGGISATGTPSSSTVLYGNGTWASPFSAVMTRQILTSGTGATYTTPANCRQIQVTIIGGGGGGGSSGTAGTANGGAGTASSFNSVNANPGGVGGQNVGGIGGGGGSGTASYRIAGAPSSSPAMWVTDATNKAGQGGSGGGNGGGRAGNFQSGNTGSNAAANTGGGGGGGGCSNIAFATGMILGGGGGSGETAFTIINSPSASYTYTVGAGGTGASAGTSGGAGGNGGSGIIIVDEFY